MSDQITLPEAIQRISDLEAEVAHLRVLKSIVTVPSKWQLEEVGAMEPFTEEEVHDMRYGPRGKDLREVIDELEREYGLAK
jgi:hypothetical protein